MKHTLLFIAFCLFFWIGCQEEENITPSNVREFKYTVPQGNHDYDQKIVDWYDRCGFYILYRFEPKDIFFNSSEWLEVVYDSAVNRYFGSLSYRLADEDYIGKQLELMEDQFLNFYPDTMLRRCMPMKLLLCGDLENSGMKRLDFYSGLDNIAVNWGSDTIGKITEKTEKGFKADINKMFLERLTTKQQILISKEFAEVSPYNVKIEQKDMYSKGLIYLSSSNKMTNLKEDWMKFIFAVIENSYEDLIADTPDNDYTFKGILNEKKDTKGLIRKKYDILIDYLKKQYGTDLQAIGNQ